MLSVKTNIAKVLVNVTPEYKKAIQKAKNRANYYTAKIVKDILISEMKKVFDRPTPWTLSGIEALFPKDNGPAIVRLKEFGGKGTPAVKFLSAQVYGGGRALKSFERKLYEKGILPEGYIIVPGKSARLDKYGNISPGLLIQIGAVLQVFAENGYLMNSTRKSLERNKKQKQIANSLFVINKPGNRLRMGIYQRDAQQRLHIVLAFVRKPNYKERFKFFDVAITNAKIIYPRQYPEAFSKAMSEIKLIR